MSNLPDEIAPRASAVWRRPSIILVLLLLAAGLAWRFWGSNQSATDKAAMGRSGLSPVAVAVTRTADIRVMLDGLGTVTPTNTVAVRTRVDGQLMRILFRDGQNVKAGDLLAEIDPRPFEAQLLQAQGQLTQAQAQLQNAQLDLKRYQQLAAQDLISAQQADTQKALVVQYQGAVTAAQGTVTNAKLQLDYCHITAPIGGRVGLRQIDSGNMVHASDTNGLVILTQSQPATIIFSVPQDNLPELMRRLATGAKLPVEAWDRAATWRLALGQLIAVDSVIDVTTGTVKLKAQFGNADNALFANQFVNARLLLDTQRNAVAVPTSAILRGTSGPYVYLLGNDQTVSVRPVTVGPTDGDLVAIAQGLRPGDQVVIDGVDKLRNGIKVKLANQGQQNSAQPTDTANGNNDSAAHAGHKHKRPDQPGQP